MEQPKPPLVLVIEDDAHYAHILQEKFEKKGFKVILAENGELGLKAAERKNPDIITLDVMLPIINGFDVLRTLKAQEQTKSIPVIMHTTLGQREDIQKAFDMGCEDYLIKTQSVPEDVVDRALIALS